jgi:hypothetical protein
MMRVLKIRASKYLRQVSFTEKTDIKSYMRTRHFSGSEPAVEAFGF